MCIICIKNAGMDMPTDAIIRTMWNGNPDGAGFMYPAADGVHIRKGFLTMAQFTEAIEQLKAEVDIKNIPIIMHFRIGTHGDKKSAPCTHPFPVTSDAEQLKSTSVVTPLAFAHNGIIHTVSTHKELSDTMMYSIEVLSNMAQGMPNFYLSEPMLNVVENTIDGSRMVFMDANGNITKVGNWVEDKDTGLIYSNSTYRSYFYDWDFDYHPTSSKCSSYKSTDNWLDDEMDDQIDIVTTLKDGTLIDANGNKYINIVKADYIETFDGEWLYSEEIMGYGFDDYIYVDSVGDVYELDVTGAFLTSSNYIFAAYRVDKSGEIVQVTAPKKSGWGTIKTNKIIKTLKTVSMK